MTELESIVLITWLCPIENCNGEMEFIYEYWSDIGYLHECNKCGYSTSIPDKKYPDYIFEEKK